MKEFSELWTDANSWEKRAKTIKENIVYGVDFDDLGVENTAFDANDAKVSDVLK